MRIQRESGGMTAALAWLFLISAAAAATLPAALLTIAAVCLTLAVTWLLALFLRPLGGSWSTALCLAVDGGIAWGLWELLSLRESWSIWRGPQWLFAAALLLCAPAATALAADKREGTPPPSLLKLGGVVLLIGLIREVLGAGTLFGIRLLPAFSDSFLYGAAGILTAGLCLPLAGWRERRLFRCPDWECLSAGAAGGVRTLLGGIPGVLLLWLIPDAPPLAILILTSVSVGVFGALLEGAYHQEGGRLAMGDGVLAVAAIMALQAARSATGWWLWSSPLWTGLLVGLGLSLFVVLYNRIDNLHIPAGMRTVPATLVVVGGIMLAFQVLLLGG